MLVTLNGCSCLASESSALAASVMTSFSEARDTFVREEPAFAVDAAGEPSERTGTSDDTMAGNENR